MSLFQELKRRNVFRVGIAYGLMGWMALQAADFALDLIGAPEWVIRALAVVVVIGLPIALVFAWAFELTPEGIKRDHEVDRSQSIAPKTANKLDRFIIVILAMVVAWFLFDEFYLEPRDEARLASPSPESPPQGQPGDEPGAISHRTIAVLPFRAMSNGPDDEFFADGLTEEILNSLAQVPDLSVTSRTSAFYFKDKDLPIGDIAEQLGVDHVVEGSVRRSGDQLRVTAQLIRVQDDTHLWSENYDSTDSNAIAVQEDIARRIAETLGVFLDDRTLARMRAAGLRDVAAFIEYQKGRAMHEEAHRRADMMPLLEAGNTHLAAALEVQPNFSPAWLFYSDYYTHMLLDFTTGEGNLELSEEEITSALNDGRKAFTQAARSALDPETRAASELDLAIYEGDAADWRPLFEQVLSSETCEDVIWHQLLGFLPDFVSDFKEQLKRYQICDPMTNRYMGTISSTYLWEGSFAEGLEFTGDTNGDDHPFSVVWKIRLLTALGQFEAALNMATIDTRDEAARQQMSSLVAAARGDIEEARRMDQALAKSGGDNRFLALQRAAWLGDRERANELAAELDSRPLGHLSLMMTTYWCACGAPFDLKSAPRFAELWHQADLPWPLESPIKFPQKTW